MEFSSVFFLLVVLRFHVVTFLFMLSVPVMCLVSHVYGLAFRSLNVDGSAVSGSV